MKLLTLCLLFSAIAVADDRQRLEGSWTGESLCAGVSPACHDEKVIYTFGAPDSSGSVNLSADGCVDGKRINMGSTKVHFDSLQKTVAWRGISGGSRTWTPTARS